MLRPWAALWITAVVLCRAVAQYSSDQCSWRGSGLSHESHRRDVEQVYLRCSQGSLEWLYPTGAIIVNLRPNTESSSGHTSDLHVCIQPHTYSQGSHVYLEHNGDLTMLLAEDQPHGTVHCFSLAEGALFVEAVPQADISRRITAFQYELVSSQGPGAHMYPYLHPGSVTCKPCSDEEVLMAVCTSDFAWCCVNSTKQSGIMGRPVTLKCPYQPQHKDNRKFLCKGEHRNNCTDVVTDHSTFTLKDDGRSSSFSVVIRKLKAGDAGTYWCGSHAQWKPANYTVIHLSVVFPQETSSVSSVQPATIHTTTQSTNIFGKQAMVYIVTAAAVLTVTGLVVVVVYKYKQFKVRGDGAKTTEGEIHLPEIYANHAVPRSKPKSSKPQSQHYDDTDGAEQDSVYQNYSTDAIYTNEIEIKGNRR